MPETGSLRDSIKVSESEQKKEGEFLKRIQKHNKIQLEISKEYPTAVNPEVNQIVESILNLCKLDVEESKKEFPNFAPIEQPIGGINEHIILALEKANKQIAWFKKWFGE